MKKTLIGLSIIVALAPALAGAKSHYDDTTYYKTGAYIGGSFGGAKVDLSKADKASIAEQGAAFDDTDTGFKLFGGYRFDKNTAIEGFYADLGETSLEGDSEKVTTEADTIGVSIMVIFPVSKRFELFGKVGIHVWDAGLKSNLEISDSDDGIDPIFGDDGTDPMFGVGAAYTMNQVSIRAEYERYELDDVAIDLMSLGVAYNF